jgi:hypothetical protein
VAAVRRGRSGDFRRRDDFQPNQIDLGRFNNKNNRFNCKKGGGAVMPEENIGETHLYLMLAWLNHGFMMPGPTVKLVLLEITAADRAILIYLRYSAVLVYGLRTS